MALESLYLDSSIENIFNLSQEFHHLSQQVGQLTIQFINLVAVAASDLQYLGEDLSDQ